MELHQRLTNLVQKEADRLLKDFLNDNPDLLKKYVDSGVAAVGLVLTPLNVFMRHLLVVQGLDPDTEPGERQRRELLEAVGSLFNKTHDSDFDEDYDFSWVHKKFEEARGHLKNLTKDKFLELTDISKLPNIGPGRYPTIEEEQEYFAEQPSTRLPDKEIRVIPKDELDLSTQAGRQEYRQRVLSETPNNPIDNLRSALKEIIKETADKSALSEKFNPGDAIKKVEGIFEDIKKASTSKKGIKTSKKKLNKGPDPKGGAPLWGAKGVKVNRVPATVEERMAHNTKKNSLKENIKIKYNRAKDLVDDMVKRGLVTDNKDAVQEQLQQILLMDDSAVDALKRVVAKHSPLPGDNNFKGSFRRVEK